MNVTLLDVERHPYEFQRIYLPYSVIRDKKIALGSGVKIQVSPLVSALCKAFLDELGHRNFLKMSVDVRTVMDFDDIEKGEGLSIIKIEPLGPVFSPSSVDIKLICKDIEAYVKLRSDNDINQIINDILQDLIFIPHYSINLENHLTAQLYGVSGVIIGNVSASSPFWNAKVFKVNQRTSHGNLTFITRRRFEYLQNSKRKYLKQFGGLNCQLNECYRIFFQKYKRKKGILFCGPSGSGKTTCLKLICHKANALLITVNANEFFGSREGESEGRIRSIFEDAKLNAQEGLTVLYIQSIELLNNSETESSSKNYLNRSLLQLISILDDLFKRPQNNLIVAASTHDVINVHQSLRRPGRFDYEINFGVPKFSERLEIISHLLPSKGLEEWIAKMTPGYLPADLELLISHAEMEMIHRNGSCLKQIDLSKAMYVVTPSVSKGELGHVSTLREDGFSDLNSIRGLDNVKQQLRRAIQWPLEYPEAFSRLGIKCPRGILLYGPPGCGKTSLARAFSTKDNYGKNISFLCVSGASIFSPYVGDSEKNIVEVFKKARLGAPCVLFIDEIDTLVSKRGQKSRGDVQERILSTLLNEMDGLENLIQPLTYLNDDRKPLANDEDARKCSMFTRNSAFDASDVIVIGATNRPEVLDAALIRPGRFDIAIYVPLPSITGRLDILRHKTSKVPLSADVDLEELALKTEYLSGADLEGLCREATLEALTSQGLDDCDVVKMDHFRIALESTRPSISNEMLKKYDALSKELQFHQREPNSI